MFSEQKQWLFEYVKNHQAAHLCYLTLALNILKKKNTFPLPVINSLPSSFTYIYAILFTLLCLFLHTSLNLHILNGRHFSYVYICCSNKLSEPSKKMSFNPNFIDKESENWKVTCSDH